MAYDPYRCLSDQELDAAIRRLVDALTSGASQISSPDAGSVGYQSVREGERLLEKMERSRAARRGETFDAGRRIRYTRVYVRQDDVR